MQGNSRNKHHPKDAAVIGIIIPLFNTPVLFVKTNKQNQQEQNSKKKHTHPKQKKYNKYWKMKWITETQENISLIIAVVPDVACLLEQISMISGTW